MKKYIVLLLTALLLILPACSNNSENEEIDTETESIEQTVDARLDKLQDHGWIKNDTSFTLNQDSKYSEQQITAWLDGDDLAVKISYEYGDRNAEIQELYGDDESVTMGIAARWFADIETITGESFGNMKYYVIVGGETVGAGTVAESEALESASEYDD